MKSTVRARFRVEAGLASLCGCLAALTLFCPDWIETLTGFNPDHHQGWLEGMIVSGLLLACILVCLSARAQWRRLKQAAAES